MNDWPTTDEAEDAEEAETEDKGKNKKSLIQK